MIDTAERELYSEVLDAAVGMVGCSGGSVQVMDEERRGLRLVAHQSLHPASVDHWAFVESGPSSVCGMALASGARVVVEDVEAEPAFAGSAGLREFRRSGLRAIQSTPLLGHDGGPTGMLSTYWAVPHRPSSEELRLLDLLTRFMDSERLPVRCAWCSRLELDGRYIVAPDVPEREPELLRERPSHGICPECLRDELRRSAAARAAKARLRAGELREAAAALRAQARQQQRRAHEIPGHEA